MSCYHVRHASGTTTVVASSTARPRGDRPRQPAQGRQPMANRSRCFLHGGSGFQEDFCCAPTTAPPRHLRTVVTSSRSCPCIASVAYVRLRYMCPPPSPGLAWDKPRLIVSRTQGAFFRVPSFRPSNTQPFKFTYIQHESLPTFTKQTDPLWARFFLTTRLLSCRIHQSTYRYSYDHNSASFLSVRQASGKPFTRRSLFCNRGVGVVPWLITYTDVPCPPAHFLLRCYQPFVCIFALPPNRRSRCAHN